jgi:predicted acyltransferase
MGIEKSERLVSLDVFRGITIAGMILVNSPGSWEHVYPPLLHSKWNGCTPTDIIFPFFMFIVGVALTYSISKRIERNDPHSTIILQVLRRSIIIFLLGLFLNGFPNFDFNTLRIPGVLQRIAIAYLIASIIYLKFNRKVIILFTGLILLFYWGLMTLVPVPGIGHSSLDPSTNLGAWLDRFVFGNHLWGQSKVWDPEGILSSIPSIATVLIGILTGYLLKSDKDKISKTVYMFVWGNILIVAGIIWDLGFPINKNLWTSSYVIYTAGLALDFLGMCYWFIDIRGNKTLARPFLVFGMNAITAYFLSEFIEIVINEIKVQSVPLKDFLFNHLFLSWVSPINASLMWAICYVIFIFGLMSVFYKKKIFIKV